MKKTLRVRDVFSIATGAMIGSGFFLLPGIARRADEPRFPNAWAEARDVEELKELILAGTTRPPAGRAGTGGGEPD